MKNYFLFAPLLMLLLIGCQQGRNTLNSFSSSNDTLVIETSKQKGVGVFSTSSGPLSMNDTSDNFITTIVYPIGLEDLKRTEKYVDFKNKSFYDYKRGKSFFLEKLLADIENNRIDTSVFLPESENVISILEGYVDGRKIIIVDENNNKDLTDDSLRIVEEIEWSNPDHFVELKFPISNGNEIVEEVSWINFRTLGDNKELDIGKFEHLVADFRVDDKQFKIASIKYGGDFTYDQYLPSTLLFVLLNDEEDNEALIESDYLQLGQFVKLDDQYYCIEDISHNGGLLTLVKEKDFSTKIGIQVGVLAPEFACITEKGDTLHSKNLKDKGIIVVNMCGCSGNNGVFKAYEDILSKYGDSFHVLGVDSNFGPRTTGTLIDSENPFNEEFSLNYRQAYCSYFTYVINKEFRIEKKLTTMNWRDYL